MNYILLFFVVNGLKTEQIVLLICGLNVFCYYYVKTGTC